MNIPRLIGPSIKLTTATAFLLCASFANAQVIISDDFNVTNGDSEATGFGIDEGVNTEITDRLTGQAALDQELDYILTLGAKAADAYSITDNQLLITSAEPFGGFELSNDGVDGFDFGPYLRGKIYEIEISMDNDSVDTSNRRMSFTLGTTSGDGVGSSPLSLQLQANADQNGSQLFKRITGIASPAEDGPVNVAIASDLPYGEEVNLRIVVADVDTTFGYNSSYEIYLNGNPTPIDSGDFGIRSEARHLIFDVAPLTGPATYDDWTVTVTGDAPEAPELEGERYLYFVGDTGDIYGFTGIAAGEISVTSAGSFTDGFLEASHPEYGDFQAFTTDPTSEIVYGINEFGDVVTWPTLEDWFANTNATIPDEGEPGYDVYGFFGGQGSVHGASYDPNTGGFYVVYEGTDPDIDGDIGEYTNANDFLTNSNATISPSVYGGNILNFYYWGEDAPTTRVEPNNTPGANYFHATGGSALEGFLELADYIDSPDNRTFGRGGFCAGCVGAFALPMPVVDSSELALSITEVTRNGSDNITSATLEFAPAANASYTVSGSPDLETEFMPLDGFEQVTTSPVTVTIPAGYESIGFLRLSENP
jgi:hypothetical protein